MTVREPYYSKEEFARRGDEMYESQVRPQVEEGNYRKMVAIDIETGDFEVDFLPNNNLKYSICLKEFLEKEDSKAVAKNLYCFGIY